MNITQRFRQIALATILGASCCSLGSASANAFTFQDTSQAKIEFFDTSGTFIGNGGFTYKPFSGSFIDAPPQYFATYESPDHPFPPPSQGGPLISRRYTPPEDYAQITSFTADLFTVGFTIPSQAETAFNLTTGQSIVGRFVYFWKPPNSETFTGGPADTLLRLSGGDPRHPGMGEANGWIGCLPACGISQRQVYTISSDGTWNFFRPPASGIGPSFLNIDGTWRATAIPEPGTLAGSIAAAIVIWRLKQHRGDKGNA